MIFKLILQTFLNELEIFFHIVKRFQAFLSNMYNSIKF